MSSISVSEETKREWDKLKEQTDFDGSTHDDFAQHVLDCCRRDNGEIVDVDSMVEEIKHGVASEVELSAYRGCKEYHE